MHCELNRSSSKLNDRIKWVRKAIGALLFIAGASRPDIQYAVNYLARFVLIPHDCIIEQIKRIFSYLKHTSRYKIRFNGEDKSPLIGYSDADWSGDKSDFISSKGSMFMYGDGPVSWKCKKSRVCQSSTESEILAYIQTANMAVKLRRILRFVYGFDDGTDETQEPTPIFADNNSMLKIVTTGTVSQRTAYLGAETSLSYQFTKNKIVSARKVETDFELADILTKPVKGTVMNTINSFIFK